MPYAANFICLLDDEPSLLKALGRLFASEGLHAEKFSEPARFLEHARNHHVRLAVIDIRMPGMSGLEVMAELRAISPGTQVIVITGENNPDYRNAAMAGGASAFFFKPFDDEALVAAVHAAFASGV